MRKLIGLLVAGTLLLALAAAPVASADRSPCQNTFTKMAAVSLPAGYWSAGEHWYEVDFYDPVWGPYTLGPVAFTVTSTAPIYPGSVFMRMFGLSTTPGVPSGVPGNAINPAQPTVLYGGFAFFPGDAANMTEVKAALDGATVSFAWDAQPAATLAPFGPITNSCAQAGVLTPSNGRLHVVGQVNRAYPW